MQCEVNTIRKGLVADWHAPNLEHIRVSICLTISGILGSYAVLLLYIIYCGRVALHQGAPEQVKMVLTEYGPVDLEFLDVLTG